MTANYHASNSPPTSQSTNAIHYTQNSSMHYKFFNGKKSYTNLIVQQLVVPNKETIPVLAFHVINLQELN